jgi:poly-gamma-glutamate synthesis protein (capsule biosynthesis protein)
LPFLDLSVNLLHGLERVEARGRDRINAVEVGRHGLRIHRGEASGLLLPVVAVENDWDAEAFLRHVCRKAGLPTFGGGLNAKEAHTPWIVERNGLRIALLGYAEFKPRSFEASATRPGLAWSGEDDEVINDIVAARTVHHADIVIPFMHWGWEDEPQPSERLREFSRRMLDAGADMVVGGHPHVTQGVEYYKGKLIMYSLGNFLFNGFDTPATTTGWVLSVRMNKAGMIDWRTRVARLDANGVPHPDLAAASPCGKAGVPNISECRGK